MNAEGKRRGRNEELETVEENPILLDPGRFYAKSQVKSRKKFKKRRRQNNRLSSAHDLAGSYSHNKKSRLNYAFLQPQDPPQVDVDSCSTPGTISAFQFMNFAIAAATLAGNLVANANNNNRNNNNNNVSLIRDMILEFNHLLEIEFLIDKTYFSDCRTTTISTHKILTSIQTIMQG